MVCAQWVRHAITSLLLVVAATVVGAPSSSLWATAVGPGGSHGNAGWEAAPAGEEAPENGSIEVATSGRAHHVVVPAPPWWLLVLVVALAVPAAPRGAATLARLLAVPAPWAPACVGACGTRAPPRLL